MCLVFQIMAGQEQSQDQHKHLVGICMGMCPNAEVRLRQREKMIHPLEMAIDCNGRRLNYPQARAMVKVFSRPAAGQEVKASDVRPVPVLMKTIKYLLTNVCCQNDISWALVYQFVYDRLQAIRQDLCVQGVRNSMALQTYQAAVRFYVYAHYRTDTDLEDYISFCGQDEESEEDEESDSDSDSDGDSDSKSDEGAETKIVEDTKASEKDRSSGEEFTVGSEEDNNKRETHAAGCTGDCGEPDNLAEKERVLPSDRNGKKQNNGDAISCCTLREEAVALYMLVNLGNEEAIMNVLRLPQNIKCSKLVVLTLKMNIAWLTHNYYRVLTLSTRLPPLCQCAFHPHLNVIQRKSLEIINQSHSCKGQSYSLDQLSEMLLYNTTDDLAEACTHYGLLVGNEGVVFTKGTFNWEAPTMKPCHTRRIEDHLATVPLSELLIPTLRQ
ncbi:SAC3 family protein C [Chionoecetes opilio]|uniref:SAC3 family protein C n=1 Tax=Chionoecetes opilio TaxID=41210 RepID=A0A8J4XTL8_CHIOP|nr:SAC3 family protein C [Chionoecetes opilio]